MPLVSRDRLALFAAYAVGQLRALNADHRLLLEYPGVQQDLPQAEIRRGWSDGKDWVGDLLARNSQDLPEHVSKRGSVATKVVLLNKGA